VATVIQKVGPDGQLTIQVEPPGPEHESDLAGSANHHHLGECRLFYTNCRNVDTKNATGRTISHLRSICIVQYFAFHCVWFLFSSSVLLVLR